MSADILKDWHEFYLLIGTAAAALIALLFVAAAIGAGSMTPEGASATRTYMSPIIFHFTSILFMSLVVLVPTHPHEAHSMLLGLNAIVGVVASTVICARVLTHASIDWFDRLGYGAAPVVSYVGALAAAVALFFDASAGPDVLATSLVLLLIANIRNAWDLALTMARRHGSSAK